MAKSILPEEMFENTTSEFTLESIASKLTYFQEQLHLIHWQTASYAEHKAVGNLYEYIQDFKDTVIEKLMGYLGKKPKAFKIEPLKDMVSAQQIVVELGKFAYQLYEWAEKNEYCDIENMAQDLSGESMKVKYLLTLS